MVFGEKLEVRIPKCIRPLKKMLCVHAIKKKKLYVDLKSGTCILYKHATAHIFIPKYKIITIDLELSTPPLNWKFFVENQIPSFILDPTSLLSKCTPNKNCVLEQSI